MLRLVPRRAPSEQGKPLRLLCLGAHSDDIEIGCGGTLMRLLDEVPATAGAAVPGVEVRLVVFSASGEREAEARTSASALLSGATRAEVEVHAFRESFFPSSGAAIKDAFEALKRSFDPELILTHHRTDLHQDHALIAALTWQTFRAHLIIEYEIPKYEGELAAPNVFVPLAEATARRKVDHLLRCFESQTSRSWFRPATFEALMRLRGVECAAPEGFAEAFTGRKLLF